MKCSLIIVYAFSKRYKGCGDNRMREEGKGKTGKNGKEKEEPKLLLRYTMSGFSGSVSVGSSSGIVSIGSVLNEIRISLSFRAMEGR